MTASAVLKNRARTKAWALANPERTRARGTAWKRKHSKKINATARQHYQDNIESERKKRREYRRSRPMVARAEWYRRKFGITLEQLAAIFVAQGSRCACCARTEPGSAKGWHTDHDHAVRDVRGKCVVRGIVCHHCNVMIGAAREQIENLLAGVRYLGGAV